MIEKSDRVTVRRYAVSWNLEIDRGLARHDRLPFSPSA
jgi:hypothetical protein